MTCHAVRSSIIICLGIWLIAAMSAAPNQQPSSAQPNVPLAGATISDWKGKVQLKLPGGSLSSPTRGQVLSSGTLVDTGDGSLVLRLEDGSQILVRAHTRMVLKEPSPADGNYLRLLLGRIRAQVNKRTGGAPPFQLGTPSAVIAVRGTRFDVEVNERSVTEVDVFEGLVEVVGVIAPEKSVFLEPGFSTRVGLDGSPEPPRPTGDIRPDTEGPDQQGESTDDLNSNQSESERNGENTEMQQGPDQQEPESSEPPS